MDLLAGSFDLARPGVAPPLTEMHVRHTMAFIKVTVQSVMLLLSATTSQVKQVNFRIRDKHSLCSRQQQPSNGNDILTIKLFIQLF